MAEGTRDPGKSRVNQPKSTSGATSSAGLLFSCWRRKRRGFGGGFGGENPLCSREPWRNHGGQGRQNGLTSDVSVALWTAVALASALALVALTGCESDWRCTEYIEIRLVGSGKQLANCYDPRARLELLPSGAAVRCVCPGGEK